RPACPERTDRSSRSRDLRPPRSPPWSRRQSRHRQTRAQRRRVSPPPACGCAPETECAAGRLASTWGWAFSLDSIGGTPHVKSNMRTDSHFGDETVNATPSHSSPPPGPRGLPFFGSVLEAWRDPLGLCVEGMQRYGDIARYRFGPYWFFLVNHVDDVQ